MRHATLPRVLWLAVLLFGSSVSRAAPDPREMRAREAFGAGRYQDALDLFVKLYAEKLHPNYLRNIGRCYQNLGEPDRAISSFHEYMRKAKNMKEAERVEIEGYIAEMEQLKKTQQAEHNGGLKAAPPAAATAGGAATGAPPAPPTIVLERDVTAAKPASPPPALDVSAHPTPAPARDESSPVYTRWWLWAIVGGVVVAGVGGAAAAGVFTKKADATCQTGLCK
jgi:hypothetical protein